MGYLLSMTVKQLFDNKIIWFNPPLNNKSVQDFAYQLKAWIEANQKKHEWWEILVNKFLMNWNADLVDGWHCFYLRFTPQEISYYGGHEDDYEDAVYRYHERVEDEGYKPVSEDMFWTNYDETSDIFDSINESDDLGWAEDIISEPFQPKRLYVNNKRYAIPSKAGYENWRKIGRWPDWYPVVGTGEHLGEQCFIINLSRDYPRVFIPISEFTEKELEVAYKKFMTESTEKEPFLFRKKIWFDDSATREDIEKVYQFLVNVGYEDFDDDEKEDYFDEIETFIEGTGLAYIYLTQRNTSFDDLNYPMLDYGSFADINLNLDEIKEHPNWIYYKDISTDFDQTSNILSNLNESIEMKPKVGDYLYCHTEVVMEDDGSVETTIGKFYQIKSVGPNRLEIKNDHRGDHAFSTDPEMDWYYGIWFNLVPKETKEDFENFNPEDIFNQLN